MGGLTRVVNATWRTLRAATSGLAGPLAFGTTSDASHCANTEPSTGTHIDWPTSRVSVTLDLMHSQRGSEICEYGNPPATPIIVPAPMEAAGA